MTTPSSSSSSPQTDYVPPNKYICVDGMPMSSLIELDFDQSVDWIDSQQTQDPPLHHQQLLQEAVRRSLHKLFVVIKVHPLRLSKKEMNHLLLCYYGFLETAAAKHRDMLFDSTILFPWAGSEVDVVHQVLTSSRVSAVLHGGGFDPQPYDAVREAHHLPKLQCIQLEAFASFTASGSEGDGNADADGDNFMSAGGDADADADANATSVCGKGGNTDDIQALERDADSQPKKKKRKHPQYSQVVIGGTFDHLHEGHKILVTLSAQLATEKLVVGLSVDELLVKKKHVDHMQSYEERLRVLGEFVRLVNPSLELDVEPLHDMYGPSGVRPDLKAIVVSEETRKGGEMVNTKRKENGVPSLDVVVVGLVSSHGAEEKVSSTHIREELARRQAIMLDALHQSWSGMCEHLAVPNKVAKSWWQRVRTHYMKPQRFYHTIYHIEDMMALLEPVVGTLTSHPDAVRLAVWFHDVIYDPKASDNEEKSAELFAEFAGEAGLPQAMNDRIQRWIMSTKTHKLAPEDANDDGVQLLLDVDLAVLGRLPMMYDEYANQIRLEFLHIDPQTYGVRRPYVLQHLLNKTRLFETDHFYNMLETRARQNVAREILCGMTTME